MSKAYDILKKKVSQYWDENGTLQVIYAGELMEGGGLDQLMVIADEIDKAYTEGHNPCQCEMCVDDREFRIRESLREYYGW